MLLCVVVPGRYLESFAWDVAKYSMRRPLPELVSLILSVRSRRASCRFVVVIVCVVTSASRAQGVGSVDDELKQLTMNLTEATQRHAALSRKKGSVWI